MVVLCQLNQSDIVITRKVSQSDIDASVASQSALVSDTQFSQSEAISTAR
jgi:hypothetical protein